MTDTLRKDAVDAAQPATPASPERVSPEKAATSRAKDGIVARWFSPSRRRGAQEFLSELWGRLGENRIPLTAGAISFFTLLSLAPLLLFAVTVAVHIFFVSPEKAISELQALTADLRLAPAIRDQLQTDIFGVLSNKGVLTDVFLALLSFWSGSQIFLILETAMNLAWRAPMRRPYLQRRGLALLMVLVVGTLMLVAVVLTSLIRVLSTLEVPLFGREISAVPWVITGLISYVVPTLLVAVLFTVIYRILPTKRGTLRTVLPGAIFSAVLWIVSVHVFGWYVTTLANYSIFYGSLSGVVLVLIWFFYSALIMLIGAEISATYHDRLLEAGNQAELRVEAQEHALEMAHEAEVNRQNAARLQDSVAYYGYQGRE